MHTQVHHLITEGPGEPGAPALTFKDTTVTHAELRRDVLSFGAGLHAMGLARGERVAVFLDKRIETVVALFGAAAGGGVFVPVNPVLKPRQVGHILRDCDVKVLVTTTERFELLREELQECPALDRAILIGGAPFPARTRTWKSPTGRSPLPTPATCPPRRRWTWTWPRSSTRRAAPASRRAWFSHTAT